MKVGQCIYLINDFVCSDGKYQNFPCPFRNSGCVCSSAVIVTQEMKDKWEKTGIVKFNSNKI